MKFNPRALALWAALAISAYLYCGTMRAALGGLLIGLCISLAADVLSSVLNQLPPSRYR